MDHVAPLHSAQTLPMEVPLLQTMQYDFLGFEGFPKRQGFDLKESSAIHRPAKQIAGLMQSWLFFGLLSELSGRPIAMDNFTYWPTSGRPPLVMTKNLYSYLDDWTGRVRKLSLQSLSCKNTMSATRALLETEV